MSLRLLAISQDAKTPKGEKKGYLTGILYLAPHRLSRGHNLCPFATPGCIKTCLNTAGRGIYPKTQAARLRKTELFFTDRHQFVRQLWNDLFTLEQRAFRYGLKPVVRLNGTSDLPWEMITPFPQTTAHGHKTYLVSPVFTFYDYTKNPTRYARYLDGKFPDNYHLTFSRSECNHADVQWFLDKGGNVAVVFSTKRGERLPKTYLGARVIDGDLNDLRFRDPGGVVIGLRAKGKARHDTSGFVVQV